MKTNGKNEVILSDSILSIHGSKKLEMGNLDYPECGYIRFDDSSGKQLLIQTNNSMKRILLFDYKTGENISSIDVSGVKGEFFAYNADTAIAIMNERSTILRLWDKGEISNLNVPVMINNNSIEQYPRCDKNGAVLINGKWYFSCFRLGEYPNMMKHGNERFPLLEVDFKTQQYTYLGAYPEIYARNNMGTLNYWIPSLCSGKNDGKILMGFRASPEMLLYSPKERVSRFVTVKSLYADSIPLPLTAKGRDYFSDSDSYYYYAQYSHYGDICYDRWRKIYYRFVGIGLNDWTLERSPMLQNKKKWSIMIFDESFQKIGEQYIGDAYNVNFHFVAPDGLYILNSCVNEDIATYSLFKYLHKK